MFEQKETTALASSVGADERQLSASKTNTSVPDEMLKYKNNFLEPLEIIDGKSLLAADLPPLRFVVDDLLPQGLFILAGSPKVGKSWLALAVCQCVASGGKLFGRKAAQGSVLYLALEDSLQRLQDRYSRYSAEGESGLCFSVRGRTLKDGLIQQVEHFIAGHPDTALIVIDTMQKVRGHATDKNCYVNDYNDMDILRQITSQHDVAVLLVTHTRKMDDADPLNRISGSTGLIGAVDGVFILEKEERTAKRGRLTVTNRDTDSFVFQLDFDAASCQWALVEEVLAPDKPDPLFPFLVALMADKREWQGTATELCTLAPEYDSKTVFTAPVVAKRIRASQQVLLNKYGLWCQSSFKNNQKIITIKNERAEPPQR